MNLEIWENSDYALHCEFCNKSTPENPCAVCKKAIEAFELLIKDRKIIIDEPIVGA